MITKFCEIVSTFFLNRKITKNADQNFTKYGENLSQQLVSQNLVKVLSLDFSPIFVRILPFFPHL